MKKLILSITIAIALAIPSMLTASYAQAVSQPVKTETAAVETTTATTSTEPEKTEDHSEESTGVAGMFGLNWKLFLAQLINFGIVLFVLWKWVFKPVTSGMEARAKKIEDSLNNAEIITKEKEEFTQWRDQEMANTRKEASQILTGAKNDAEKLREQILTQTKQEQEEVISKAKAQLELDKNQAVSDAKTELANLVVDATEKLIKKKVDQKTDSQIITDSLKGLSQ